MRLESSKKNVVRQMENNWKFYTEGEALRAKEMLMREDVLTFRGGLSELE